MICQGCKTKNEVESTYCIECGVYLQNTKNTGKVNLLKEQLDRGVITIKEFKDSLSGKIVNNYHESSDDIVERRKYQQKGLKFYNQKWADQLEKANYPIPIFRYNGSKNDLESTLQLFERFKENLFLDEITFDVVINHIPPIFFNVSTEEEIENWNTRARANMLLRYLEDEYSELLDIEYTTKPLIHHSQIIDIFISSIIPANE